MSTGKRSTFIAIGFVSAALMLGSEIACAAAPDVEYLFPAGGRQDSSFSVTFGGKTDAKIDPWPAKVWIDCPGVEFHAEAINSTFTAHIAKDATIGPHLVRVYNEQGASAPRMFIIGRHTEVIEQEPNDDPRKPQMIETLPAIVNGRLEKNGDGDAFSVEVEAGRWLVAELQCRRLGSPVDPVLHVFDSEGVEVAFNHDTFGLDPLVAYRAPRSGRYIVQVAGFDYPPGTDVRFAGSRAAVYRLLLTTGPYARYAMPAGVRRGEKMMLKLAGWNLGETGRELTCAFDGSNLAPFASRTLLAVPQIDNTLELAISDAQEQSKPPAGDGAPPMVQLPVSITSRLDHPSQIDRYHFTAAKGETLNFTLPGSLLNDPLDGTLAVEDAAGKVLAHNDESSTSSDAALAWTAPADGTYTLAISDLNHRGGEDYFYRVEIKRPTPEFRGTLSASMLALEAGKSADFSVTPSRRGGFSGALAVVVSGLPEGVTAATIGASTKGEPFVIALSASAGAPAASAPIRVLLVSPDEHPPRAVPAEFELGADQLVRSTENFWLTVTRPPPTTQPAAAPAVPPK